MRDGKRGIVAFYEEFQKIADVFRHVRPAHAGGDLLVNLRGVAVRYEGRQALDAVDLQVLHGERIGIVGPNGAGKSTLFKVIAGVLQPNEGEVQISGSSPTRHTCVAYVPQRSSVDWNFPVTVAEVVMMGRVDRMGLFRWPSKHDWDVVYAALDKVGLSGLAGRQIGQLSGGQQQRMFLARALAQEAELILLDEPFTGLDAPSQDGILAILDDLHQNHVTLMVSLHDLELAAQRFERILLLNHRIVASGAATDVLHPNILTQAYGGHLHMAQTSDGFIALGDSCCDDGEHQYD
jgi:ABC-type Mn2+/Zn2+ transport system ATPase subunit